MKGSNEDIVRQLIELAGREWSPTRGKVLAEVKAEALRRMLLPDQLNLVDAALRFCAEDLGETGGEIRGIPPGVEGIETLNALRESLRREE